MDLMSMTIVVPSHQDCYGLERLLVSLARQLDDPALRSGLDVVVVLDGSHDGSKEMLASLDFPVPLAVVTQRHSGLATARNSGLLASKGDLVWFLDSDLVPQPGSLARHRRAHMGTGDATVVTGPTPVPAESWGRDPMTLAFGVPAEWRGGNRHGLVESRYIDDFRLVAFANTSAPARLLTRVGGFDETFTEYGFEELELAARLLESGVRVRFEPDACAWHHTAVTDPGLIRRRHRAMGRNAVQFTQKHPRYAQQVFGSKASWRSMRLFASLHLSSARSLAVVSDAIAGVASVAAPFLPAHLLYRIHRSSWAASFAAGVADRDTQHEFLPLLLRRSDLAKTLRVSR
jgi:GT2 family glycosyltransferase